MSPENRTNLRITAIIIAADLVINVVALFGYNAMRQHAMEQSRADRAALHHQMDEAWAQREELSAKLLKACRR